jgi:large subunit ribosomal protein L25
MAAITFNAELRTSTGSADAGRLRAAGKIPGVLYGKGIAEPISLFVDHRELRNTFNDRAVRALPFTLVLDGVSREVKIQDIQRDPVRGSAAHVDFLVV